MAIRFSGAVALGAACLAVFGANPIRCLVLGTVVVFLTTYFRWKSSIHGRAATTGVLLGTLVVPPVLLMRRFDHSWDCGQHVSLCLSVGIAFFVVLGFSFQLRGSPISRSDLTETGIVALLGGLVSLTACVGVGVAALGTVVWVCIIGLTSRAAALRFAMR